MSRTETLFSTMAHFNFDSVPINILLSGINSSEKPMPNHKYKSSGAYKPSPASNCNRTSTESYLSTENRAFQHSQILIRATDTEVHTHDVADENLTMDFPDEHEIREHSIGGKNVSWDGVAVAAWGIPHPSPKGWMEALRTKDVMFFARRGIFIRRRRKPIPWEEDGLFTWG
jgi:hypothetical protein